MGIAVLEDGYWFGNGFCCCCWLRRGWWMFLSWPCSVDLDDETWYSRWLLLLKLMMVLPNRSECCYQQQWMVMSGRPVMIYRKWWRRAWENAIDVGVVAIDDDHFQLGRVWDGCVSSLSLGAGCSLPRLMGSSGSLAWVNDKGFYGDAISSFHFDCCFS